MSSRKNIKYNTLDIDDDLSGGKLEKALNFIKKCPYVSEFTFSRSLGGKGWHVRLYCSRNCEKCRKLFDDPIRYRFDKARKEYSRNVLHIRRYLVISIGQFLIWAPHPGREWLYKPVPEELKGKRKRHLVSREIFPPL